MATTPSKKLRIGLLLDSYGLSAWEHTMLERIQSSNYAKIVLVVVNANRPTPKLSDRFKNLRKHGLFSLYMRLEKKLFHPYPDAFAIVDGSTLLGDAVRLDVNPKMTQHLDRFSDVDVEHIETFDLDVIVRLGFRILRGKILKAAHCGVWSYHHGDSRVNRGGPAGFWEVMTSVSVTGSMLQVLTEELDDGLCLCRSWSATEALSVRRNRNNFYWKTLSMLPRKLEELHRLGPHEFMALAARDKQIDAYSNRLYLTPGNAEFANLAIRHLWRRLSFRMYKTLFRDQWFLLFHLSKKISTSMWRFRPIMPPKDRFWADPCAIIKNDRYYVFLEEFLYKTNRGHISVLEIDSKGNFDRPYTVLKRPYHLSYPFVFEWENTHYMIPETSDNQSLELYRCDEFPGRWSLCSTLMEGVHAVDATIFQQDGIWWMFVNMAENRGSSSWDELFLFYSDHPISPKWNPHPKNPIVSDVHRARPAGRPFVHNERLYRPAQDCSQAYGYGIRINEILSLTKTEYEEREVSRIEPLWDKRLKGIHTFSRVHHLTVVDAKQQRSRF